jgi:hypothetical protein
MRIGIRPPKPSSTNVQGPAFGGNAKCAVSSDILKKDFRPMTFGSSTGTARDEASSYLTKGFLRSVSAGIGSQKGVLRFLGEEASISGQGRRPAQISQGAD